jgi:hypothetical protein
MWMEFINLPSKRSTVRTGNAIGCEVPEPSKLGRLPPRFRMRLVVVVPASARNLRLFQEVGFLYEGDMTIAEIDIVAVAMRGELE